MHVPPPGIFQGNHAIIIGSSISGLLAARVLAAHFDRVTVFDRDMLPGTSENRLGVPQGRHGHGLLASGLNGLKRLFPSLERELLDAGAVPGDVIGSVRWFQHGHYKARFQSGLPGLLLSRPLLETSIRRQVKHLPNVRIVDHNHVLGLIAESGRVTGIRVQRDTGETSHVMADLVVDATGRSSRSPEWLESLGFPKPDVEEVTSISDIPAASTVAAPAISPATWERSSRRCRPTRRASGSCWRWKDPRWMVTIGGWLGSHAPTDPQGYTEFARSLARPDIYDVIKDAEPVTDPVKFVFPSNLRRRYDRLTRFPNNFLVMGDAVCSFNPLYGQGMSVATLEALALDECLSTMSSPDRVWRPFFKAAAKIIETPWTIAAGSDFAFTGVTGPRPAGTSAVNWYLSRVHKAASVDRHVCRSFFDVANLLRPATTLFAPSVVARVAECAWRPTPRVSSPGVRLDSKGRLIETT